MAISRTTRDTSPVATNQMVSSTPTRTATPTIVNHGAIKADTNIARSGDLGKIGERISAIYGNRSFGAPGADEIDRLARQIAQTGNADLFGNIRQQVDSTLGSDAFTRASMQGVQVTQPALSAADLAGIMAQRRAATGNFEAAQDQARLLQGDVGRRFDMQAAERTRMFEDMLAQLMGQMGDRGMGFQPAGAGQGRATLAEAETREADMARMERDRQLAEIAEAVAAARRARDAQLAQLEAEEQRRRSALHREFLAGLQF